MTNEIGMQNTEWRALRRKPIRQWALGIPSSLWFRNSSFHLKQIHPGRRASVLVGLLWCLAILSVVVVGVLRSARLDLLVVKNHGDQIQAHYLALAGIEKAKALLYRDAAERKKSAKNHTGEIYDAPQYFRDVPLGRGQFRVFRQARRDEGNGILYGISDEESRLNLNQASADELQKLSRMPPETVAAILDWRDEDNAVTTSEAETEYYASLQTPCLSRHVAL